MKLNSYGLFYLWLVVLPVGAVAGSGTGEWQMSLDGRWEFTTNAPAREASEPKWDVVSVPGNWDTLPAYSTYKGKGWYRRSFNPPGDWKGKRLRLRFEAVYHDAEVTLNGQRLGSHVGGYTPFEFDVTDKLRPGETNTLTVCADSNYRRGAWWHWGGISRSVVLIANHDARIVWQHIRSEPGLQTGEARVFVRYQLTNSGAKPLDALLSSQIDGVAAAALKKRVSLPARSGVKVDLEVNLTKLQVRLWDFDHPNLYRLTSQLCSDGVVLHERNDRFGLRKVELTRDSLLLNGERVRLCGFNRVSDSWELGNTEPDKLVCRDVDLMKRAGANLARLMHYPQAPNLLDYLDEKGMLIWCEIPVWGSDDPQVKQPQNPLPRQWMSEMVDRDYNHPCIIGWSVGNELAHHFQYVSQMSDFTRKLDPHRIITHVSNTGARSDYTPANDPISVSDIILYNTYSYNRNAATVLHEKWPDKPMFFSEFGIKQFGASPEATIQGLEDFYHRVTGNPYVIGISLWTFNDYRSDYKGTPSSGNREWGIVDANRKPKAAYEQVRKLYSPVHALVSANGSVRVEPRRPEEVPSYTLRGYKLTWKGGELALPDFKPGSPSWTSPKLASPGTIVRLVTPTGYVVQECRIEP